MTTHLDLDALADLLVGEGSQRDVAHLEGCPTCSAQLGALDEAQAPVRAALATLPAPRLPDGFAERLDEALRRAGVPVQPARTAQDTAAVAAGDPAGDGARPPLPAGSRDEDDDRPTVLRPVAVAGPGPERPPRAAPGPARGRGAPGRRRVAPQVLQAAAATAGLLALVGGAVLLGRAVSPGGSADTASSAAESAQGAAAPAPDTAVGGAGGAEDAAPGGGSAPGTAPAAGASGSGSSGSGSSAASSSAASSTGPLRLPAGKTATTPASSTGLDYARQPQDLARVLPLLLRGGVDAERPGEVAEQVRAVLGSSAVESPAPGGDARQRDAALDRLRDPRARAECLGAVPPEPGGSAADAPPAPLAVDYAAHAGRPALVAVLPSPDPARVILVAVGAGCRRGAPQLLARTDLPRP